MHYFGFCPKIRSSSRFLREIWISYFARRVLEGIFVGGIVNIRNECLFSRFMGNESQCGTNKSHENRFAVHAICLFRTAIDFPWTEKKDTHSLIILEGTSKLRYDSVRFNPNFFLSFWRVFAGESKLFRYKHDFVLCVFVVFVLYCIKICKYGEPQLETECQWKCLHRKKMSFKVTNPTVLGEINKKNSMVQSEVIFSADPKKTTKEQRQLQRKLCKFKSPSHDHCITLSNLPLVLKDEDW